MFEIITNKAKRKEKSLNDVYNVLFHNNAINDMSKLEFVPWARLNIDIFGYFIIGDIKVKEV